MQRLAGRVLQRHGQCLALAVQVDLTEELVAVGGWQVGLAFRRRLLEHHLGAEGGVELAGAEGAGVQRAADELPERGEVLEARALRRVVMRRRVVHIGGQPHHVVDRLVADRLEQPGDLLLAAQRLAGLVVGHGLEAIVVAHHQADGHVGGDDLPGGGGIAQRIQQPAQLLRAEQIGAALLTVAVVGAAEGAHVEHEHFQARAVGEAAVDAPGRLGALTQRHVLEEGLAAAGGQQRGVLLGVAVVFQQLAGIPVVGGLVVVPLGQHRHLGVEAPHVGVQQVVGVLAAEFLQGLGHLELLRRHPVAPQAAVGELDALLQRAVGVDGVAGVDEEVGALVEHGGVGGHAAARLVDAPALAHGVAGPHEAHVAWRLRRQAQPAGDRFADRTVVAQGGEAHPVVHLVHAAEPGGVQLRGEAAGRQRFGAVKLAGGAELGVVGDLEQHPGRAVDPRPQHGAVGEHVAAHHAAVDDRAPGFGQHDAGGDQAGAQRGAAGQAELEYAASRHAHDPSLLRGESPRMAAVDDAGLAAV
ncbi:hypothetical protein HHA04nite_19650 [Halomonas halophila]|uniref:Uncharacterized protein n=1 Tax=Halomonas halophila TaxID=29573 RepID=A0ABQ0U4N8_9GAMM|nr:hypothetical protein HHA04nite_19650 [Halomonas halophila]